MESVEDVVLRVWPRQYAINSDLLKCEINGF